MNVAMKQCVTPMLTAPTQKEATSVNAEQGTTGRDTEKNRVIVRQLVVIHTL